MRNYFTIAVVALLLTSCEVEAIVPETKVPAEITNYLDTHFPGIPVLQVLKNVDGLELTYAISLKEGVLVEFNRKGEFLRIDSLN